MQRTGPDWAPIFLADLRINGQIQHAAEVAGIAITTFYDRRNKYPDFAKEARLALTESNARLEREARRRAHDGVDKPVFYKGKIAGEWVDENGEPCSKRKKGAKFIRHSIKEYSDQLLGILLKAHNPKFREKTESTIKAKIKTTSAKELTDEELLKIIASGPIPGSEGVVGEEKSEDEPS